MTVLCQKGNLMEDKIIRLLNREVINILNTSYGLDEAIDGVVTMEINPIKGLVINTEKLCKDVNEGIFDPEMIVNDICVSWNKILIYYTYKSSAVRI